MKEIGIEEESEEGLEAEFIYQISRLPIAHGGGLYVSDNKSNKHNMHIATDSLFFAFDQGGKIAASGQVQCIPH